MMYFPELNPKESLRAAHQEQIALINADFDFRTRRFIAQTPQPPLSDLRSNYEYAKTLAGFDQDRYEELDDAAREYMKAMMKLDIAEIHQKEDESVSEN